MNVPLISITVMSIREHSPAHVELGTVETESIAQVRMPHFFLYITRMVIDIQYHEEFMSVYYIISIQCIIQGIMCNFLRY